MSSPFPTNPGSPNPGAPNPMTTPPFSPLPPLPPRPHRSLAGPFVLIVVGTVCLLGTMGVLSRVRMWHLFANYWPVLLILGGIVKLIEHMRAQREGYRARGIGAGGVFLVIMIVVFGLIATQIEHVNWSGIREQINLDDNDFPDIFADAYNFNDHLEQDFPAGSSLKVIDSHGVFFFKQTTAYEITIVVRKRIKAENQ